MNANIPKLLWSMWRKIPRRGKGEGREEFKKLRQLLLAYLQNDGWKWENMATGADWVELEL